MAEFKYRKKRKGLKDQAKIVNNDYREIALTKMGKRQLVLTLLSIFAVTLISIGSTFAMFTVSSKSSDYNVVKSGTLTIDFSSNSSTVGLNGALPMSDSDGLAQTGNTFTIKNTGSLPVNYTVSLQDDTDMITQDGCSDKQLNKDFIKYNYGVSDVKVLSETIDDDIISDSLEPGKSITFTLRLWISDTATNDTLGKHYHGKIVVNGIQNVGSQLATTFLINKANPESLDYNTATHTQKKEMWTFSHDTTEQMKATTDYRYIGKNPNNYVKFNDELWRIIGVFDVDDGTGKIEKRLKIIRNEVLSNGDFYSWGYNSSSGYTINDWKTSQLNTMLNSGAYYNRTTGIYNNDDGDINVDFTKTGLTDNAKAMIGDAKWYLGGAAPSTSGLTVSEFYTIERGTKVYLNQHSTYWIGKVGLIYPSDYGYSTGGYESEERSVCLSKNLMYWGYCENGSWLYPGQADFVWTITPYSDLLDSVFFISPSAGVYYYANQAEIQPVVYLKSTIKVISGMGAKGNPYILSSS